MFFGEFADKHKDTVSLKNRLKAAEELLMEQFRDKLIEGSTGAEIHEAAQKENKEKFSGQTWYLLCMKLIDLHA
ncbi:hypothetical protein AAVH_18917 [Aphelenchoides avenae]|nr:hypothetical protein AAVH_18917 [Aphelenchus avenae]